jgi:hypothetical protein
MTNWEGHGAFGNVNASPFSQYKEAMPADFPVVLILQTFVTTLNSLHRHQRLHVCNTQRTNSKEKTCSNNVWHLYHNYVNIKFISDHYNQHFQFLKRIVSKGTQI